MNRDNRQNRKTGMNSSKQDALKRLGEARNQGKKRLDQVKESEINNLGGIDDIEMDYEMENEMDFIENDGIDYGYVDEEDLELEVKRPKKEPSNSILQFIPKMANGKLKEERPKKNLKNAESLMKNIFEELDNCDEGKSNTYNFSKYESNNISYNNIKSEIAPELERKLNTNNNISENINKKVASSALEAKMEIEIDPPRNIYGREIVTKDSTPNEKNNKRTRDEVEKQNIVDKQFISRTPITNSKSERFNSDEKTPASRYETPIKRESEYIPESNISSRLNISEEKIRKNNDGSINVYWYDACEETIKNEPVVIIFGKILDNNNQYTSISLVFRNLERTLYLFPKLKDANDDSYDISKMYDEFESLRKAKFSYIKNFKCKEVKRKYCFELPIPNREYRVLKIKYNGEYGTINPNITGETFDFIFGKNTSFLEKLILKMKLKGPCWLKINNFELPQKFVISWSTYEINIKNTKSISVETGNESVPPLKILSISTKSININGVNEILCICATFKDNYKIDDESNKNNNDNIPLVFLRKTDGIRLEFLDGIKKIFGEKNFIIGQNENALLNQFIINVYRYDPDIITGHNLYTGHIELILNRISYLKLNNWSRIGKLKREVIPKFLQSSNIGNIYVRNCVMGRLVCDTLLSCRDVVRESNYQLSFLSEKYLKETLIEMDSNIPLPDINNLQLVLETTLREAYLAFLLTDKFGILPLTKQLTNIAGNLWSKSLQNSRADRCEMLLSHEFHNLKYIIPDKFNKVEKDEEDIDEGGKRKPQYSGGLVLEPITGLYDTIVLLLDFNSLYPSIIQEYNICFTTVQRKPTQSFFSLEEKKKGKKIEESETDLEIDLSSIRKTSNKAILPSILESLVQKRKFVKELMKKEKNPVKLALLEIKQKAIKLSANSLYGYLGYKNSRFYAKAIASLITLTGRNILSNTVNLVKEKYDLQVIYGDTDSIMLNTHLTDLKKAIELGQEVKKNVNQKYRLLEMELDGVFKSILLLKKKKYAALKFEPPYDNNSKLISENKGLDLVRRDWCDLSKEIGKCLLNIILSNKSKDEIINHIFELLREVSHNMLNNKYQLEFYQIVKQLTKNIDDYADGKTLPHVKVAKRLKDNGDVSIKVNSFIPYIICITDSGEKGSLADRAFHPKEVDGQNLKIDLNWYKQNQILASVSRLCKHITEIDMYQLAQCLGIDGNKYLSMNNKVGEMNHDIIMENNNVVKLIVGKGINIKCTKCENTRTLNKIVDNKTNISSLLKCECGHISKDYGLLYNNIMTDVKKGLFRYFRGNKICTKCQNTNRLFFKNKCNCYNGYYKKELNEYESANEINFIRKLLEKKFKDGINEQTLASIVSNTNNIELYIEELDKKIEYNVIDLDSIFSWMNNTLII